MLLNPLTSTDILILSASWYSMENEYTHKYSTFHVLWSANVQQICFAEECKVSGIYWGLITLSAQFVSLPTSFSLLYFLCMTDANYDRS
jgi:hypothetical protein